MHKGDLTKHKTYYCTNKHQFKCPHCLKTFSLFHNLKRHILSKHGISVTMEKDRFLNSNTL